MKFIKLLVLSLLVVINCCSCGESKEKDVSSKITLKNDLKITCSLEEVFLTGMATISNGEIHSAMIIVKKDGNVIYPGGKGPLPKNVKKALDGLKGTITIPKGTNIEGLVKIINTKFSINGKLEDNNFVIDIK